MHLSRRRQPVVVVVVVVDDDDEAKRRQRSPSSSPRGYSFTTIRVERGGFKKYRLDLQRKQAKREAAFVALTKARKDARERRKIR
jgi:hypothetical protein